VTLPFTCSPANHEQQRHGNVGSRLGEHVRRVGDRNTPTFCRRGVYVVEADAEVGEQACSQWLGCKDICRQLVGYRTEQGVCRSKCILKSVRAEGPVVTVEPDFEVLA
jgi:hypothetical protein